MTLAAIRMPMVVSVAITSHRPSDQTVLPRRMVRRTVIVPRGIDRNDARVADDLAAEATMLQPARREAGPRREAAHLAELGQRRCNPLAARYPTKGSAWW